MEPSIDLENVEKKARALIPQDGLEMIMFGILQCTMALGFYISNVIPVIVAAITLPFLLKLTRKKITYPRVGYASFEKNKKEKLLPFIIGLLAIWMLIMIFIKTQWISIVMPFFVVVGIALWALSRALTYGEKTWYLFTALYLASGIFVQFLQIDHPAKAGAIALWCVSPVLIIVGVVRLSRFLSKYPKPSQELLNGGQ